MTMIRRMKTVLLAAAASAGLAAGAAQAAPLFETEPKVVTLADARGEAGIKAQLREAGFTAEAIAALVETKRHQSPTSGRLYLEFEQRLLGTPVYGSQVRATIEPDGTLSRLIYRIADLKDLRGQLPRMANERAVAMAVGRPFGHGEARIKTQDARRIVVEKGDLYHTDPVADRVVLAGEDGAVETGYLVRSWAEEGNALVHTLVDASGRALGMEDRTSNESYIAFKEGPADGNPRVMSGDKADPNASPRGWLDHSIRQYERYIRGNNAEVYVDRNADDGPDWRGPYVWDGHFDALPRLDRSATDGENKKAAVQSLFYHLNAIHDRLYRHGFTETAGNFQKDNFGRGGRGGDHVIGEALDGSGTNNANIAVPINDGTYYGTGPRMQMYYWTRSNPTRPGSFESDIIWHEYGHGVLWRMVGDLDWPISWAVNEGFADSLAIVATAEDRVGEWAANRHHGIRRHRYEGYPYSLGDFRAGKRNAHRNGEIFAAAMWKTRQLLRASGVRKRRQMDLIIDGLANTRSRPTFLHMRDGLLAAARDSEYCLIWRGFAAYGMGTGARMSWSGTKSSPSVAVRESSALPTRCGGSGSTSGTTETTGDDGGGTGGADALTLARADKVVRKFDATRWYAGIQVTIEEDGRPVAGRDVRFDWVGAGDKTCTTNSNGICWSVGGPVSRSSSLRVTVKMADGTPLEGRSTSHGFTSPF